MCIDNVHSDFGGLFESSDAGTRIGFVLHIRTLASSPPVAIREPSGWTCTEKIESRFVESVFPDESPCITHAGFVKCMSGDTADAIALDLGSYRMPYIYKMKRTRASHSEGPARGTENLKGGRCSGSRKRSSFGLPDMKRVLFNFLSLATTSHLRMSP